MNEIEINSLEELYNRLVPAMDTKISELKNSGVSYITRDDIWNYLKNNKWNKSTNLTLSQCVDDILNTNDLEYKKYIRNKLNNILGGK